MASLIEGRKDRPRFPPPLHRPVEVSPDRQQGNTIGCMDGLSFKLPARASPAPRRGSAPAPGVPVYRHPRVARGGSYGATARARRAFVCRSCGRSDRLHARCARCFDQQAIPGRGDRRRLHEASSQETSPLMLARSSPRLLRTTSAMPGRASNCRGCACGCLPASPLGEAVSPLPQAHRQSYTSALAGRF